MEFKYAVFDMDGTLIKSMDDWDRCERRVVGDMCGINLLDGVHSHFLYKSLKDLIEKAQSISGKQIERADALPAIYALMQGNYDDGSIKCVDGAVEYLSFLKQNGVKIAIATATDFEMCRKCLKDNGLLDLIDVFVSTSMVGKNKYSPDVYLKAVELLGGTKEQTLFFEDACYCLETLKDNALNYAVVYDAERSGIIPKEILDKAEVCIHSYKELLK